MCSRGFLTMDPSPQKTTQEQRLRNLPDNTVYFEVSPSHKPSKKGDPGEEVSILRLVHFTHCPKIDFEKVKLGTERKRILRILNPKDVPQEVTCEKVPGPDSDFSLSLVSASLLPTEYCDVELLWRPCMEGTARETLQWRSSTGVRAQTVMFGVCVDATAKKGKKGRPVSRQPLCASNITTTATSRSRSSGRPLKTCNGVFASKENRQPKQSQPSYSTTVDTQAFKFSKNASTDKQRAGFRPQTVQSSKTRNTATKQSLKSSVARSAASCNDNVLHSEAYHQQAVDNRVSASAPRQSPRKVGVVNEQHRGKFPMDVTTLQTVHYDGYDLKTRENSCMQAVYADHHDVTDEDGSVFPAVSREMATVDRTNPKSMFHDSKRGSVKKHVMWEDDESEVSTHKTVSYTTKHEYYEEEVIEETYTEERILVESYHKMYDKRPQHEEMTFCEIIGGKLPDCNVECSPVCRQTYIKGNHYPSYQNPILDESIDDRYLTLKDLVHEPSDDEALEISAKMKTQTVATARLHAQIPERKNQVITQEVSNATARVHDREAYLNAPRGAQHKFPLDEEFRSVKENHLPSLVSDSPARRETYVSEAFRSIEEGQNLPYCDIVSSPVRRQTFIKNNADTLRRSTLTLGISSLKLNCDSNIKNHGIADIEEIPEASSPSDCDAIHEISASHDTHSLVSTPITPLPDKKLKTNLNAITASCMDLLNQLDDDLSESPDSISRSNSYLNVDKNTDLALDIKQKDEILNKFSNLLNDVSKEDVFQTSKSLLYDNVQGKTLYTSRSKDKNYSLVRSALSPPDHLNLGGNEAHPTLNLSSSAVPSLRRISESSSQSPNTSITEENEGVTQGVSQSGKEISSQEFEDSLDINLPSKLDFGNEPIVCIDTKFNNAEYVSNQNLILEEQFQEVDKSLSPTKIESIVNAADLEAYFRRLSTDTVTKETSILLPEDIVSIDDVPSIANPVSGLPVSLRSPVQEVIATCETECPDNIVLSPWSDETALSDPVPYLNLAEENTTSVHKDTFTMQSKNCDTFTKPIARHNVGATSTAAVAPACGLSEQTYMCASLSEFSFHPSSDPRRCSTGVKAAPPSQVLQARSLEGAKKLFTAEDEHQLKSPDELLKQDICSVNTTETVFPSAVRPDTAEGANVKANSPVHSKNNLPELANEECNEEVQITNKAALDRDGFVDSTGKAVLNGAQVKVGLEFIEISPPSKRRANSPAIKLPGWGQTKRTRYEPRPAVRVALSSLKLAGERKPPPGRPRVVSSKVISPVGPRRTGVATIRQQGRAKELLSVNAAHNDIGGHALPYKPPLKKSVSASNVTAGKTPLASSITLARSTESLQSDPSSTTVAAATKYPNSGIFSKPSNDGTFTTKPSKLHRRSIATPYVAATARAPSNTLPRRSSNQNIAHDSGPLSISGSTDNNSSSGQLSLASSNASRRRSGALRKCVSMRSIPVKTHLRTVNVVGLVQHPNPFAAENMFYDNRWVEKQTAGFTRWLNFVLTAPDDEDSAANTKVEIGGVWRAAVRGGYLSEPRAPSRETLSLRAYTARGRFNRLRRAACRLYAQPNVVQVVSKLEAAIDQKLIMIRKDRQIHIDVGMKQQLLQLLLCYNPLWLRLALETVFGELLLLSSNSDMTAITQYIVFRLLSNPDIQRRFAHPSVPHSYRQGYEDAVKQFLCKKFLVLVLFLDEAKTAKLIDHNPCLFRKDAQFKSSRDILLEFARDFLSGVGDFTKHLGYMGYVVHHQQGALDEFDYALDNLATDLRCGVRLARVAEILSHVVIGSLNARLRVPAVSRLQKVHNTTVALQQLQEALLASPTAPVLAQKFPAAELVAGHRETTLGFLWTLIFHAQLPSLVSLPRLREEVQYLRRSLDVRALSATDAAAGQRQLEALLKEEREQQKDSPRHLEDDEGPDTVVLLLKRWVQYCVAHYGVLVYNFTVSLSDGRALCLLLHHYHPELVPLDSVSHHTTHTVRLQQGADLDVSADDSFSSLACADDANQLERAQCIANEKNNHDLFANKLFSLGGVPLLVRGTELVNTIPDERVLTTFVALLCGRLLQLSEEIRAARVLQMAWRRWLVRREMRRLQVKAAACVTLQRWWRRELQRLRREQYVHAAVVLQAHWRRRTAQRELQRRLDEREHAKRTTAAHVIQSAFRQYLVLRYIAKFNACVAIQSWWRACLARRRFTRVKTAALMIQTAYRGYSARLQYQRKRAFVVLLQRRVRARAQRAKHLRLRTAATVIQRCWRARWVRAQFRELRSVAVIIQSAVRGYLQRRRFLLLRSSAVRIQSWYRGRRQTRCYAALKEAVRAVEDRRERVLLARSTRSHFLSVCTAARLIQNVYRGYIIRRNVRVAHNAATTVQAAWRCHVQTLKYLRMQRAAVTIQSRYRALRYMKREQNTYQELRRACVLLQATWRGYRCRMEYRHLRTAVICLQRTFKANGVRKIFLEKKSAALVIQRRYRAKQLMIRCLQQYTQVKLSVVLIQKLFRGYFARKKYKIVCKTIIGIQAYSRRHLAIQNCKAKLQAITLLQSHARAWLAMCEQRTSYLRQKQSALCLQRYWRGRQCRAQLVKVTRAALVIQKTWRMARLKTLYKRMTCAATTMQRYYKRRFSNRTRAALTLQSYWRMWQCRKRFCEQRKVCVLLQEAYRAKVLGRKARGEYLLKKSSAVKIQSFIRQYFARRIYLRKISAVIVIQMRYRATRLMQAKHSSYLNTRRCVIMIQATVRMQLARQKYQRLRSSVLILQGRTRAWLAGKLQRRLYCNKKAAAVVIQTYFRMWSQRRLYWEKKAAAVVIQKYYRMWNQKRLFCKKKAAAVVIQKYYRMWSQKRLYCKRKAAAVVIQKYYRMWNQKRLFCKKKAAAVVIQKYYIMWSQKRLYCKRKAAAVVIQKYYRMWNQKRLFCKKKAAAVVIQKYYRMWSQKRLYCKEKAAAVVIQKYYRMWNQKRLYCKKKAAAVVIQKYYKMWSQKRLYYKKKAAAVVIQKYYRMWNQKRLFCKKKAAAVVIQKYYRMWSQKRLYCKKKAAAVVIQKYYRMWNQKRLFCKKKAAAVVIQKYYIMWSQKRLYCKKKAAAVVIQKYYRMWNQKRLYCKKKAAAVVIQKYYRMWSQKRLYYKKKAAAVVIQKYYRMWNQKRLFCKKKAAAVVIQKYYRMWNQKRLFCKKKAAAVVIQKYYRMWNQKRLFCKKKAAAVVIQKYYIMWSQKRLYCKKKAAAVVIQKYYRMWNQKRLFCKKKAAAVVIQKYYRMWSQKRLYCKKKAAAVVIQKYYRMWSQKKLYFKKKVTAVVIQKYYRMWSQKRLYCKKKAAAVVIQKYYRMWSQKRLYCKKKAAAVVIQKYYRMWSQKRLYFKKKAAAVVVQKYCRMWSQKRLYCKKKAAAVVVQKYYRMWRQRRLYCEKKAAAVVIQKYNRMWSQKRLYGEKKAAAVVIQKYHRMWSRRKNFLTQRQACILLQSCWRMCLCKRYYHVMRKEFFTITLAAVTIQKTYRMWRQEIAYQQCKRAAVLIQRYFRSYRATVQQRQCFLAKKQACSLIQRRFRAIKRAQKIRAEFTCLRSAAVKIQSYVRRWLALRRYRQVVHSSLVLQERVRAWRAGRQQRDVYLRQMLAIVAVQRRYKIKYRKMNEAALLIQRNFRMVLARNDFKKKVQAILIIQNYFRGYLLTGTCKKEFEMKRRSSILFQKQWRMLKCRRDFLRMRRAAITIQTSFRSYRLTRQIRNNFIHLKMTVIKVQSVWRMVRDRNAYLRMLECRKTSSAVMVQKHWRGYYCRQRHARWKASAVTVQKNFRMTRVRRAYTQQRSAAMKIQVFYRGCLLTRLAMMDFSRARDAVIRVQSWWRMVRQRRCYVKTCAATVFVQANVRRWLHRRRYLQQRLAAVTLQRYYRGCRAMHIAHLEFDALRCAAVTLQAAWRMCLCRRSYARCVNLVVVIQRRYRAKLEMQAQRQRYQSFRGAAIVIQRQYRANLAMKAQRQSFHSLRSAAIAIQRQYRANLAMKAQRQSYHSLRGAAIAIQRRYTANLAMRVQRQALVRLRIATILMQRRYRALLAMHTQRQAFRRLKRAAVIIQASWRGIRDRKLVADLKMVRLEEDREAQRRLAAVLVLQQHWRGAVSTLRCRERFIYQRRAAVILQAAWRGWRARRQARMERAAVTLQRCYRAMERRRRVAAALQQKELLRRLIAARTVQRWWRLQQALRLGQQHLRHVVALQRCWRQWREQRKEQSRRSAAATVIQAAWRGHRTRYLPLLSSTASGLQECQQRRLTMVRQQLVHATERADASKCLGNTTEVAIVCLAKYRDLRLMLQAVIALEAGTRWSAVCCQRVVSEGTLQHLLRLMAECNRSLPYVQILTYVLTVLTNLAKCPGTFPYLAQVPGLAQELVRLLAIYHEKHPLLFTKTCTVLYILCDCQRPNAMRVSADLRADTSRIFAVMVRKAGARARGQRVAVPAAVPPQLRPSLLPHYALATMGRPSEFDEPLSAVFTLLELWQDGERSNK